MDEILKCFMEDTEKEFYVREIAKLVKKSPTTVSKYLDRLKGRGILRSRIKFNHLLFRANKENYAFKDLKIYYNIKKLRSSGLIDYLVEEFNSPEAIVLFGSFRKAEDIPGSDIDLLIITPIKKEIKLEKFKKKLGRDIQLFLFSKKEINKMKLRNKNLLNNLINGIVLCGFWELF